MKKAISILTAMVMLLALCACPGAMAEENALDDSVITLQMSDEAKKHEEENTFTDAIGKAMQSTEYYEELIQSFADRTEQTFPECAVENELNCEEFEGCKVYTLSKENYENIVYYIHGGGWVNGIAEDHVTFCDALVTRLNAKVYMPLYPLAPEANSEETYAMVEALYKEILKEGKNVYVMGDSAGGNIALGLLYAIKAEGLEQPQKTVLLAPCVDMSMTNEDMNELNQTDPILNLYGCKKSAALWAGEENLKDPKNSALYADVTGYPDIMLVQGTNDILCPDVMLFYEKLKDAGVNVQLVIGEGLWHVFPVEEIPEKYTVLEIIEEYCLGQA